MKKLTTMWVCVFVIHSASVAQMLTLTDASSGKPVEYATVSSQHPRCFVLTDELGQAEITACAGATRVEIRILGYNTEVRSFRQLQEAGFAIALTPAAFSMDQIIISASRWSQSAREVPGRVTTISARQSRLQNPQTAADMLWTSGEVFVQKSQQGGGSPMIRGFATNRLLYAVDGVRMNTAIFRSGNIQNVISLDPFATESTEVLFGPGSVIYGSDAIGGIMSFTTLTPRLSTEDEPVIKGNAVARYSSANDEKTTHFDINAGWRKWSLLTSLSSNDFGDLRMGSDGPEEYLRHTYIQRQNGTDVIVTNTDPHVQRPTGYQQINLMQKVRFAPNEDWDLQYALHYSATTLYSRYDRLLRLRQGLPRSAEWNYGPQKWLMHNFSVSHSGRSALYDQVSLRLAYQQFEESRIERDLNRPTRFIRIEEVDAYSANLDFLKAVRSRHYFFYGLEAVINDVTSSGTNENVVTDESVAGPSRYPLATWSSYAAYLNYKLRISEKMIFQSGARINAFAIDADFSNNLPFFPFPFADAKLNRSALTGSAGIVINPSQELTLSFNLSTGFRAPNVDDIGKVFDSEPGSVVIPNTGLSAEQAYNAEFGIAKVFGHRVRIDLTGYYTSLQNALVRRNFQLNGMDSILYHGELSQVQAIQNAASAYVYGVQAGIELKLGKGFSLYSRFNYQDGEEELDDGSRSPLRHAAPWFGVTRLAYAAELMDLQLYAMYSGQVSYENLSPEARAADFIYAVDDMGRPYAPGWWTLNFKAAYPISDVFTISAGMENILDKRYRPYSSGIVSPGRNVILSVRAMF